MGGTNHAAGDIRSIREAVLEVITLRAFLALLLLSTVAAAQQTPTADVNVPQTPPCAPALIDLNADPVPASDVRSIPASSPEVAIYTLAAGTRIAVTLKHAISTKNARVNDPVYAETSFPVVSNSHMVIPAGTYVQGVIRRLRRPGRIKGRGELVIGFNALIFASGYTLPIPGSIDSVPGTEKTEVKDSGIIAVGAGVGAALGGLAARSVGGADVGGLVGAGIGLVSILRSRGPDARIESGTLVEMVLERPILVEYDRIAKN